MNELSQRRAYPSSSLNMQRAKLSGSVARDEQRDVC